MTRQTKKPDDLFASPPRETPHPGGATAMSSSDAVSARQQKAQHDQNTRQSDEDRAKQSRDAADAELGSWSTAKSAPQPESTPRAHAQQQQAEKEFLGSVPFEPSNASEMYRYARMLARAKLLPKHFYDRDDKEKLRPRVDDVHFVLLKGQALGLHPTVSIGNINVIEGKCEVGALLMVSLILKSGLCDDWSLVESTMRRAVFETTRRGKKRPTVFEYTIEEAEQMGLLDKGRTDWEKENNNWRKQPRTMLRRRCQSALGREDYPDIVLGLYDHEELSEMREVADRLGLRQDQVANAIVVDSRGNNLALTEGREGPISRLQSTGDPLKDRLAARAAQASGQVSGLVKRCSQCDTPIDPRDSDPCIACRTEPT